MPRCCTFLGGFNCHLLGLKPVVNAAGKVIECVPYCESHHSRGYSYIHGLHCKGKLLAILILA